jgi:hypothetical protein
LYNISLIRVCIYEGGCINANFVSPLISDRGFEKSGALFTPRRLFSEPIPLDSSPLVPQRLFADDNTPPNLRFANITSPDVPFTSLPYFRFEWDKPSRVIQLDEPGCFVEIFEPLFPKESCDMLFQWWTSSAVKWDISIFPQFGKHVIQPRTHNYQLDKDDVMCTVPERLRGGAGDYGYVYRPRGNNPRGPRAATIARVAAAAAEHRYFTESRANAARWARGHRAFDLDPVARAVLQVVENTTGVRYNSIFASGQPCGESCMGAHSDDEDTYDQSTIADLSLGPTSRIFRLLHAFKRGEVKVIKLKRGQLMTMRGKTQRFYVHEVLKGHGPRIGLVMRKVFSITEQQAQKQVDAIPHSFDTIVKLGPWKKISQIIRKHIAEVKDAADTRCSLRKKSKYFGPPRPIPLSPGFVFENFDHLVETGVHGHKRGMFMVVCRCVCAYIFQEYVDQRMGWNL